MGGWGSCARGNRRERRSLFNECTSEGGGDLKGVEGWARIGEEVLEVLCLLPPPPPPQPTGGTPGRHTDLLCDLWLTLLNDRSMNN